MIDTNQYIQGDSPYNNAYAVKYEEGDYSLESDPPVIPYSPEDYFHTVKGGETLQNIAFKYYKDSGKWYRLAEANNIMNPFKELIQGTRIRIPYYG